jgi:hypothetical protein
MMKNKLARAISMTLAGSALALGAVSTASATSTTMYNMNNFGGLNSNTDGWVWGNTNPPTPTPPASPANNSANFVTHKANFVGTGDPNFIPLGFNGTSSLNWAAEIGVGGDSAQISAQDSLKYNTAFNWSGPAEIDTGAGAWQDTSTAPTGWKHQTDVGLIKTNQDMWVSLTPTVIDGLGNTINFPSGAGNFGITVFFNQDTNTGTYNHHGSWNCPTCTPTARPYTNSNPFGTKNLWYMTHDATVDSSNPLTFPAVAGMTYSIYIGGAGVGNWGTNLANYKLDIATTAVPIPAATWLFGGAMVSLIGAIRRKRVMPV